MADLSPHARGLLITTLGVLVLTPDSLLIRLVSADAWTLTFWRGVLYAIGMSVTAAIIFGGRVREQFLAMGRAGLLIGAIFGIGKVTFIVSITNTTAANTLFIVSTSPLFAAIVAWLLMREPVARSTWIAMGFALLGIGVIASEGMDAGSLIGNVAALLTALVLGTSFALARRYRERNLVPAMALSGLISALLVLPLASPLSVAASDVAALATMGLLVLPLSFGLIFVGPRYIPAPEVSLVLLLEAVLGPYWVWLALGEEPGGRTLFGGTIVLATLAIHSAMRLAAGGARPGAASAPEN